MSYAALYKGTTPIINLAAGSGGGTPWVRPAWPALADLTSTDNVFTGIYGVDSTDSNFVALLVATDSGTYTVDWGDGTTDTGIASNVQANHTYDYASIAASVVGEFKPVVVTVTTSGGNITTFDLQRKNPLNASIVSSVINWLDIAINASAMTSLIVSAAIITVRFTPLQQVKIYNHSVTSMISMFFECSSLQSIDLLNTALVSNMSSMFRNCRSIKTIPLFNTAAVTNMSFMFSGCSSLQSVPLFNTSAVINMTSMFQSCVILQSVPLFNTTAVTNMTSMFQNCSSLQSVPLFNTAAVTSMSSMFFFCSYLSIVPEFNTATVQTGNTSNMFNGCASLCKGRTNGIRFTISYANCKLSTAALNDIFTGLGTASGAQTITISGNPGAATCTRSIATAKGWTVSG